MFASWKSACLGLLVIAVMRPATADASDPICPNPVTPSEVAVCDDPYLLALDMETNILLGRMAEMNGGLVPESAMVPYAHGMIGREECAGNFRCLEAEIRAQLDMLNRSVLEWQDTPLVMGFGVGFISRPGQSSVGADLFPWDDRSNFGWSELTCQLRCAITSECAAAHYDAMQIQHGRYGFCTMKSAITLPLVAWDGGLLIKSSTLP